MSQTAPSQMTNHEASSHDTMSAKPCFELQYNSERSKMPPQSSLKWLQTRLTNESRDQEDFRSEESQSEVSLEQDLLDEHKMALEALFLQTPLISNSQMTMNDLNEPHLTWKGGIFKDFTLECYLHHYLSKLKLVRPALVSRFHSYLDQQQIFYKFLQHLYYSYPIHIVELSLKYIIYAWELYSPCLKVTLSTAQIQSAVQHIYEKMRRREEEKHLNDSLQLKTERRLVMKVMVTTVVLVMEKSFFNPYGQLSVKVKRPFSQAQGQINQRKCEDVLHKIIRQE